MICAGGPHHKRRRGGVAAHLQGRRLEIRLRRAPGPKLSTGQWPLAAATIDAGVVREREAAHRAGGEMTTTGLVAGGRITAAALLGEEILGLDMAKEVVRVEGVRVDDEVGPRIDGLAANAAAQQIERERKR